MSDSLDNFVSDAFDALNETSQQPTILTGAPSVPGTALGMLPGHAVGGLIARGGMGAIYRAKQLALEREVAVKVMTSAAESPEMVERFRREALVLGRLEHPNIVPIHDLGTDEEGQLFYTMKLVKGRTLQAIIKSLCGEDTGSVGQYSLASLLTVFRKVCDAVAFAHSQGVLHRDLKPENIMVGEFGEVLVMDWGLAKLLRNSGHGPETENPRLLPDEVRHPSTEIGATLDGSVMGTPQYMSPEQAMGRIDELDERSDIFSLGGILYAILTLRPPVEGKALEEVLNRVRTAEITSPSDMQPGSAAKGKAKVKSEVFEAKLIKPLPHVAGGRVPTALSSVVMKALRLDKAQRYQSVAEFSADIEAYQSGFATKAEQAGTLKQLKLLMLRHKAVTALLAIMLTMSVGFVLRVLASERKATHNAAIATANEKRATDNESLTRQALAKSNVALAEAAFRSANRPAMVQALDAVPKDLRDQVWSYLSQKRDTAVGRVLAGGPGITMAIAALPRQHNQFAITLDSGVISVVDVQTRKLVFSIKTAFGGRMAFGISPDGSRFAVTAAGTPAIHILNASDGALLRVVPAPSKNINRLVFSPDGSLLVTGEPVAKEGKLSLIELRNGAVRWQVKGNVNGVHFSPDGTRLFTTYENAERFCRIRDVATGEKLREIWGYVFSTAMSLDGKQLALGLQSGEVVILDVATGDELRRARLHQGAISRMAWTAGGHLMTLGDEGGLGSLQKGRALRLWDASNFAARGTFFGLHQGEIAVPWEYQPASGYLLTYSSAPRLWQIPVDAEVARISNVSEQGWGVAFLGDTLLLGRADYTYAPYDLKDPARPKALPTLVQKSDVKCAVNWRAGLAATATQTRGELPRIHIHKADASLAIRRDIPMKELMTSLDFDAPGGRLLVVGRVGGVHIFATGSGEELLQVPQKIECAVFAGTAGNFIGLVSKQYRDGEKASELTIFDGKTGKSVKTVPQRLRLDALVASPDHRLVAVAGEEQVVRVFDADTLEERFAFRAHDDAITALAFHPSQPVIASASTDGTLKLWDYEKANLRQTYYGIDGSPVQLAFNPSGSLLALEAQERVLRIFDLTSH